MTATEFFIYWRCRAHDAVAAQSAARAMQAGLCERWPGLQARLLVRTDSADPASRAAGELTLMETYRLDQKQAGVPGNAAADASHVAAASAALQHSVRSAGAALQPWLCSARHIEVFEPLP